MSIKSKSYLGAAGYSTQPTGDDPGCRFQDVKASNQGTGEP